MPVQKAITFTVIMTVLGAVLVGVLSGLFFSRLSKVDRQISARVDELFAKIRSGSFPDTYRSHASNEFRQAISQEQYDAIGAAVSSNLGLLRSKKTQRMILKQVNTVSFVEANYRATFEKGEATIFVKLRAQRGEWLFDTLVLKSPKLRDLAAKRRCPSCGNVANVDAKFCSTCGSPVQD